MSVTGREQRDASSGASSSIIGDDRVDAHAVVTKGAAQISLDVQATVQEQLSSGHRVDVATMRDHVDHVHDEGNQVREQV